MVEGLISRCCLGREPLELEHMEYSGERERGEIDLLRAKMLMSVGRTAEAEGALAEAESAFRNAVDHDLLSDVYIARSQMRLCQGRMSEALGDIEGAIGVAREVASRSKLGHMLFYRGLAFLAMGREEAAHRDLNEYIWISEELNDPHAQFLGHFYHALTYERHGEPCMASAELEIAKDLVREGAQALKGRLNAFLAHLWLRRGELGEAETLEAETLDLIIGEVEKVGAANLGMAFLVRAEILAARDERSESIEIFDQAVQIFKSSRYGLYYEALAHSWFGDTLIAVGRTDEGIGILRISRGIYERLSNSSQVGKIDAKISELSGRPQANGA